MNNENNIFIAPEAEIMIFSNDDIITISQTDNGFPNAWFGEDWED